jgi:hypothetical protein
MPSRSAPFSIGRESNLPADAHPAAAAAIAKGPALARSKGLPPKTTDAVSPMTGHCRRLVAQKFLDQRTSSNGGDDQGGSLRSESKEASSRRGVLPAFGGIPEPFDEPFGCQRQ